MDARNNLAQTPLHYACIYGHTEIAAKLIASGAEVDARNNLAQNPLHYACIYGHTEMVEVLVLAGAQRAPVNKSGHTPADQTTNPEILAMLEPAVKAAI